MNCCLCGIVCHLFLKGRQAGVHKSYEVFMGKGMFSWATPPEGGLEGSNRAGRGHDWASRVVSVRQDLLPARPVASNREQPEIRYFGPIGLHWDPQEPLHSLYNMISKLKLLLLEFVK